MGNCQAIDNATILIQHPSGKTDKLYSPVTAYQVMKSNPGYCVVLLLTTTTFFPPVKATKSDTDHKKNNTFRVTRIKLLRPTDTLNLGQVYRLITNQEVMKGLMAKKHAKMQKNQEQVQKEEKHCLRMKKPASNGASSRTWQPSLRSISESTS